MFAIKVDLLNLESLNKVKNIPLGLPVPRYKFEENRSSGSWVIIGQTNRQTDRDYNFIHIQGVYRSEHILVQGVIRSDYIY